MLSATTEDSPPPAVATGREPTILERLAGLEETVRRVIAERDGARADLAAALVRAERAESYGVALDNLVRSRDAEIHGLRTRLGEVQQALRDATRPVQPPAEPEPAPPPPRVFDAPRRPVRRSPWRRPPRRH